MTVRNGGGLLVECFTALGAERVDATCDIAAAIGRALASSTGAVLDRPISPGALPLRRTLSQMRDAALASRKVKQ